MLRDVCQYPIDAEVRFGDEGLATERTFARPGAAPVFAHAHFTEAVTTGCSDRIAEDVLTQRAQEMLLRKEAESRSHSLEKILLHLK